MNSTNTTTIQFTMRIVHDIFISNNFFFHSRMQIILDFIVFACNNKFNNDDNEFFVLMFFYFFYSSFYDFFCREFRERRKQNAIKNGLNQHYRSKKARRVRTQHTFYPMPPPSASELENYDDSDSDDEFIDYNAVSISMHILIFRI